METVIVLALCLIIVPGVYCDEDSVVLLQAINNLKHDMQRLEDRSRQEISLARVILKAELSQLLRGMISEVMEERRSEGEMTQKQLKSEIRQLKRVNHHMKMQIQNMIKTTDTLKADRDIHKDRAGPWNKDREAVSMCYQYHMNKKFFKRNLDVCRKKLNSCDLNSSRKQTEFSKLREEYRDMRRSCLVERTEITTITTTPVITSFRASDISVRTSERSMRTIAPLGRTTTTPRRIRTPLRRITTTLGRTTTTLGRAATTLGPTTTTPGSTPAVSTSSAKPQDRKNRILVGFYKGNCLLREVDIQTNTVKPYSCKIGNHVTALAYVARERKLLIALDDPRRIVSSESDSEETFNTLRDNIWTFGMTVDETRQLVFMTTREPRETISRVSTDGTDFRPIMDISHHRHYSMAIAVNPWARIVYVCGRDHVYRLTYEGSGYERLASGTDMFGLSFSVENQNLYYNDDRHIMSYHKGRTVEVARLDVVPWNLAYDKATVYFSSVSDHQSNIGAVYIGTNTVVQTLHANLTKTTLSITMVP